MAETTTNKLKVVKEAVKYPVYCTACPRECLIYVLAVTQPIPAVLPVPDIVNCPLK